MPIRTFLNGEEFDQDMVRILGVAFEQVCKRKSPGFLKHRAF